MSEQLRTEIQGEISEPLRFTLKMSIRLMCELHLCTALASEANVHVNGAASLSSWVSLWRKV